ncbi:MAG: type II toxin-antitoxin system HicA family toxin [Betaproteobacteria bacterium]|nr:type II toxin-antitoxin system HicA family toxin [Betaproteobacteria bacterium]
MTRREKLLAAIRNNAKNVRFEDACKVAELVGFVRTGGKGSHTVYARKGEPTILNFQNRNGYVPPYQARQLIAMMDKYEG